MVLKRNQECGFIAYDAPTIPRARRSARKRILSKKTSDEGQLCAFELLAAVAGKLLQESESSSTSSSAAVGANNPKITKEFVKDDPRYKVDHPMRTEHEEQGSSEESVVSSAIFVQKNTQNESNKEAVDTPSKHISKQISSIANTTRSGKVGSDVKPLIHTREEEYNDLPRKIDGGFPNVDNGMARGQELKCGTLDKFSKLILPIQSSGQPELGHRRSSIGDSSHVKHRNNVKLEGTDDDEYLSQCSNPISQKAYASPTSANNCQTRNLLTSKYWKSAPKLKDFQSTNSGCKRNNINHSGESCFEQERSQHNTPFKKRKLFSQSDVVMRDGGISSESVSNLSTKGNHNSSGSVTKHHSGNKISSSSADCERSLSSSHVKLSIKSFKIPELLIEVPESTTVGSLKKTVLDAVTTVLGGGLHVGVLLHGKKIRDDSKTLLQTGISEDDNLNDLNFILEPSSLSQLSLNPSYEGSPVPLPTCELPKDYVNRSLNLKQELCLLDKRDKTTASSCGRICQDLVPFAAPDMENKPISDCRALVPIPEKMEALAAVPINTRPRRTEMGQRRTRRPFSVSEVEALVQAVEKLGTGRWRDVKLCAFENAKHRTYVDLKDKWKTLVHTARISPQQRRGEPVPQQLLDRVLAAHAYWSQHAAKQHAKQQQQQQPSSMDKVAATNS